MMFKRNHPLQPSSPCGLAFDDRNAQIIIAEYAADGGFDIHKAVIGERRAVNLLTNDFRTTLTKGNAHTEPLPLALSSDAPEETILRAILEKTKGDRTLLPSFTRTPDDRIVVTQVDAFSVDQVVLRTEKWLEEQQPTHTKADEKTIRAETRTRAITRLWRALQLETPTGTAAILLLSEDDYTIGLWSEHSGLIYETEEDFEPGANSEIKCFHTRDTLAKFITAASLAKLTLPNVTTVVLSAADSYGDSMLSLLNNSVEFNSVSVQPLYLNNNSTPLDQATALAIGALLDHAAVPSCNLAIGPEARLNEIETERQLATASHTTARLRVALVSILLPFVAALAILIALFIDNSVEALRLQAHIDEETATAQKLAQANSDYESSKANFAAFQSLLDNLIALRNRQPATHQLLADLNQRWPVETSWFIREINVKGANVEIKGKTKNEQAITSFAKSLEFSNGLFSGILTRNSVANTSLGLATSPAAQVSSSMIEFTITSTYAPLALPNKTTAPQATTPVSTTNNPQTSASGSTVTSPISPSNLPTPTLSQGKEK
ncbi:MAG: PilN domain-containing protein [Acidobacteria bacterium]|nr:PilN domain-containing protein [Acidobacteriota bacterium]